MNDNDEKMSRCLWATVDGAQRFLKENTRIEQFYILRCLSFVSKWHHEWTIWLAEISFVSKMANSDWPNEISKIDKAGCWTALFKTQFD